MIIEYAIAVIVCATFGYWCVSRFSDLLLTRANEKNRQREQPKGEKADDLYGFNTESRRTCFQILGILPNASPEEIKAAYRTKVRQYHPDRVADLGIEIRQIADEKMKELNAAYQEALGTK